MHDICTEASWLRCFFCGRMKEGDKMNGYIFRLMKCGYSLEKAREIYRDFVNNFDLWDLEIYVRSKEYVAEIQ